LLRSWLSFIRLNIPLLLIQQQPLPCSNGQPFEPILNLINTAHTLSPHLEIYIFNIILNLTLGYPKAMEIYNTQVN